MMAAESESLIEGFQKDHEVDVVSGRDFFCCRKWKPLWGDAAFMNTIMETESDPCRCNTRLHGSFFDGILCWEVIFALF